MPALGNPFHCCFHEDWHVPPRDSPEVSTELNKSFKLLFKHLAYRKEKHLGLSDFGVYKKYPTHKNERINLVNYL